MIKTIGITSTANKILPEIIEPAVNDLHGWGFKTVVSPTIGTSHYRFAGSDEVRAAELSNLLLNPEIDAILCSNGGYGTIRILDLIDWNKMPSKPIIGYSDVTALLCHIHNLGWVGVHATMPNHWQVNLPESVESLKQVLLGEAQTYQFNYHTANKLGTVEAPIIGGNLSVIYSLLGSSSDVNFDGKILFFEEIDEYPYHIDRMLRALKRAGKFDKLAGVLLGGFSSLTPNSDNPFGQNIFEIIHEVFKDYDYPLAFNFPIGHGKCENLAIVTGKPALLSVNKKITEIELSKLY